MPEYTSDLTTKSYSCGKKDNYFVSKIDLTNCEKKSRRLEQIIQTMKGQAFFETEYFFILLLEVFTST
jgi:hypothetical protein